ncbi:hypothetical protein V499_02861 [Pseudogymnoascus sp. VKM F-103]|nr:hypothetical protein V499_02861 [Pseudogymnoascus sp. VKM F-103]
MEAPAPRAPPLDPSKCHSTVETMRCSRCAMSAETVSHNGRDVSADDARAGGMVKFGHNLYYCDRCAKIRKVGPLLLPCGAAQSSGKVRASLLPHKRAQQIYPKPTTAGTLEHHTCHLDIQNGRNVTYRTCLSKCKTVRNVRAALLDTHSAHEKQVLDKPQQQNLLKLQKSISLILAHSLPQPPPQPTIQKPPHHTHPTQRQWHHLATSSLPQKPPHHTHPTPPMPKLQPPYRPDFDAETSLPAELIAASYLAFLTTILSLILLGCLLIFLLRLSVLFDRRLARDGFVGGVPREEKILRRCKERGRRVCRERGVWDVGVRGGPPVRDYEVESAEEKRKGKKLRFLPVPEVIPASPTGENVLVTGEKKNKGKGKGKERQRARSHSSHISSGHRTSEEWGTFTFASVAGVTAGRRVSSMTWESGEWAWPPQRRASADWVTGEEEPMRFFGAGSWIGRVKNRGEMRSGSVIEGRVLGERDGAGAV